MLVLKFGMSDKAGNQNFDDMKKVCVSRMRRPNYRLGKLVANVAYRPKDSLAAYGIFLTLPILVVVCAWLLSFKNCIKFLDFLHHAQPQRSVCIVV